MCSAFKCSKHSCHEWQRVMTHGGLSNLATCLWLLSPEQVQSAAEAREDRKRTAAAAALQKIREAKEAKERALQAEAEAEAAEVSTTYTPSRERVQEITWVHLRSLYMPALRKHR